VPEQLLARVRRRIDRAAAPAARVPGPEGIAEGPTDPA